MKRENNGTDGCEEPKKKPTSEKSTTIRRTNVADGKLATTKYNHQCYFKKIRVYGVPKFDEFSQRSHNYAARDAKQAPKYVGVYAPGGELNEGLSNEYKAEYGCFDRYDKYWTGVTERILIC
uniref:Uncharacterized protein n=1 Tax=Rhabditophanes sp. KR3021 TaxID=114890 RepID=A0AC35UFS8_9BILA